MDKTKTNVRVIAHYLPQFHPIPENDTWWGKGFTEWTNLAKAKPLFPGHHQPNIPADLGFYDLRLPETRIAQAEMARSHGVEGFCYYHYWFAGKRLLERPFNEVIKSGQPDFPFCLAWANQTWTGIWHGAPNRVLIEQAYPGKKDDEAHFYALLDSFGDHRYITVENKPVFLVYFPNELPDTRAFTDKWRELALKEGLSGLYFIGNVPSYSWDPGVNGFDAALIDNLTGIRKRMNLVAIEKKNVFLKVYYKILRRFFRQAHQKRSQKKPTVFSYADVIKVAFPMQQNHVQYPTVLPNWDNTPRSNSNGMVFLDSTPELFRLHLKDALQQVANREPDKRLVFVKSWNEWAEGNYLEPDMRFGTAYLDVLKEEVELVSKP